MCVAVLYIILMPASKMFRKRRTLEVRGIVCVGFLSVCIIQFCDITESQDKCGLGHDIEMSESGSSNRDFLRVLSWHRM